MSDQCNKCKRVAYRKNINVSLLCIFQRAQAEISPAPPQWQPFSFFNPDVLKYEPSNVPTKTPEEYCSAYNAPAKSYLKYCEAEGMSYCGRSSRPCGSEGILWDAYIFPIWPACAHTTINGYWGYAGAGAQGYAQSSYPDEKHCSCKTSKGIPMVDAFIDWETGYCYQLAKLTITPKTIKYDYLNPDKEYDVEVRVEEIPLSSKEKKIELDVSSTGAPGVLIPMNGAWHPPGVYAYKYKFPKFSKPQIDTLTATCSTCHATRLEVKMAPVVVGFFNGVWIQKMQQKTVYKP
ncbi:hypothetical protein [Xylophilus sp. GOD-11R]|uniref:hypothetical protein n=1 Tax=Xylophilus sp. GOD-11R TaxID=3089814 RepID=UPI00298CB768|nr:hypothetical protein [Xylophilus sp. GOD-11R]WPB56489.1 hypothetical protein R9X41_20460 [Xylophilus sp. GOD-11R]